MGLLDQLLIYIEILGVYQCKIDQPLNHEDEIVVVIDLEMQLHCLYIHLLGVFHLFLIRI